MKNNLARHTSSNGSGISVEQAETPIDESSISEIQLNQDFETSIGNLLYVRQQRYDKASLGLSLRYQVVGREDGWLDFYIYPKLRSEKGLLKRNGLVDEASVTKSAIIYYAQKAKAESMQILEEIINPEISFLKGRYEIVRDGTSYIEELYISGNEKYFLKARSTYHKGHKKYSYSEAKTIFDSLLASVYN